MTVLISSLFAAALLMVMSKLPFIQAARALPGGYDNEHPRAQQDAISGRGARAIAAHRNTVETFPLFAAGALVALMFAPNAALSSALALVFVLSRVLYIWLYLDNHATARTLVWGLGYLACLGLLLAPLYGAG